MPGATETRRGMMVLARHHRPLEDAFLAAALARLRSPRWTPEFTVRKLQHARDLNNLRGGLAFVYPHPASTFKGQEAGLSVVLRQSGGFQASNGRMAEIPLLAREPENWIFVCSNFKEVRHTEQLEVDWYIEKVQGFLPEFQPDFACGDTDVMIANRFGDDPTGLVWPLAYYGPPHVQRFGRKRLLQAPVWEAKEDERGGIWLQAVENPFTVKTTELNQLAVYLGLPKRK